MKLPPDITMKNKKSLAKKRVPPSLRFIRFVYNTAGRLFPQYFGQLAYQQWFTTIRFKTPDYEQEALQTAKQESIEVNGLAISVYIWQPEHIAPIATVLFIHGWSGRGTQIVNYIEPLTAMGYRVLSFDAPAHGKTAGKQTSMLEYIDVVFALKQHYGRFDAAITHSLGGMVLAFVMANGLSVKRAVCICPPKNFQMLTDNLQQVLALPDSVMKAFNRKSYASHGQVTRDAVNTLNNVKHLSCKSLLIHDKDDNETDWHSSEEIASVWPGAQFIKTRGLGHRRIIHDKQVIQKTTDFLHPERLQDKPLS